MQLHNHSQYSVIDGKGLIEDYILLAEANGQESFALTDHGTLGGAIELYTTAKKHNIKPILGCELYVDAVTLRERDYPGHLTVLAKNESGYRALIAANNLAARQFYYRPRLTLQQIIDNQFAKDWIILSGCMSSPINNWPMADAENMVRQLAMHSGGFFLEAMWHPNEDEIFDEKQNLYLNRIADLKKTTGLPVVLTNDCHYAHKHNEKIHFEMRKQNHGEEGLEFDGDGFHFKSKEQMQLIADSLGCYDAVDNAYEVSKLCNLVIPEADSVNWYVPDITGGIPEQRIREVCIPKLWEMEQFYHNAKEYHERFEYEMAVLKTSPAILNSYLVAHDVIVWCTERSIPAAARGSMAGSLVSYLLGITQEDPIKYRLSFSRAVNPARPTIPDFDLDVSSQHRAEILAYITNKYADTAPICAYTHYGPKGALRKVLHAEGLRNPFEINELSKQLPDDWPPDGLYYNQEVGHYVLPDDEEAEQDDGKMIAFISPTQKQTVKYLPKWFEPVPENQRDNIMIYKGMFSSMSVHPSGILVAGPERPLENEVPFNWIASSKVLSGAFDMYSLKKIGLFKLDVLGLRTLDQLEYMERVSGQRVPDDNYDDPEVLAAFGADLLAEVFQMDGYACRKVLKDIRGVETFEDIIAANTLARPGCAQFTRFYRSGFEGLLREYPPITSVLGPTNGLILYQEQVMEIARILADFDDAEQDDVKESIKYFRKENWKATIEPLFRARCEAKGYDATNILDAISKMASYTYNRAHAMTYAALAYKMMWYKIKHPAVYYAAVFDAADDKSRLVLESHFFGVQWHTADVNTSESETVVRDGEIYLGLSAIKGIGPASFAAIKAARPFTSLEDLMTRVERRKCNKKVIESMKNSFALASIGETGSYANFAEAFGFNYRFLDQKLGRQLMDWQLEQPIYRLGGFVAKVRAFNVRSAGKNQGKEMGRLSVVNINGNVDAVMFPDVWKKASSVVYAGAAVELFGNYQVSGEFIVDSGKAI